MRRLTYRAWDTQKKHWIDFTDPELCFVMDQEVYGKWYVIRRHGSDNLVLRNLIIQQYTGLYDDDGVEICEGDIVYAYKSKSGLDGRYLVVWDYKRGRWAYKSGNLLEPYQVGKAGNIHCVVQGNLCEHIEFKYIAKP